MRSTLGFIFATIQEAGPFRACLSASGAEIEPRCGCDLPKGSFRASFNGFNVISAVGGIGFNPAWRTAERLADDCGAEHLISAGVCGGLWAGLRVRDVVQAAVVMDSNGRRWTASPLTANRKTAAGARVDLVDARVYCSPRILRYAGSKAEARESFQADVTDMESAAIAEVAAGRGIPFSVVRAVSDSAEQSLPMDFSRYVSSSGKLRLLPLGISVFFQPWLIPGLLRLGRRTGEASTRLAAVLVEALRTPISAEEESGPGGCNLETLGITHVTS